MTKRKIWLAAILFLTVLTGFRLLWLHFHSDARYPAAVQGTLDLRGWEGLAAHSLPLGGEWEFYPGAFLYGNEAGNTAAAPGSLATAQRIRIPGDWTFEDRPFGHAKYGFGTYRLRILVDPGVGRSFGIHIPSSKSSSEVYVNGRLLGHSGHPAASKEDYSPRDLPYTVYFLLDNEGEIDLVIQAANFDDFRSRGVNRAAQFGLENVLIGDMNASRNMVWLACVAYAMHVLYGFILYLAGGRDKRLIYFSLMILCVILGTLLDGERLLYEWIPFTFGWGLKIIYVGLLAGGYSLHQLIKDMLPLRLKRRATLAFELACAAAALSAALLPVAAIQTLAPVYLALTLAPCLLTPVVMYRATSRIGADNIFLLLAAIAAINSLIWLFAINVFGIRMLSYPFDLIVAMMCFSAYWFKRYFRMADDSRKLAEALREADKRKDEFLSTVAHELHNPLHGIINISQSVSEREQVRLDAPSANDLRLLVKVGRSMSYMLNDLLDMARLKENRIRLSLSGISIHGVAASVIDMLRFMTEGKPIHLSNRVPLHFPPVLADETRLHQVLFNLLHNAVKYSHAGEVSVQADIEGEWAIVSVADTGIGMDEELVSRVFEPYEQAADAGLSGGFGLGLHICKQLVDMHGGTLTVRSQPDVGSVFTFTLRLFAGGTIEPPLAWQAAAAEEPSGKDGAARADSRTADPGPAHPPLHRASPDRMRLLAVDDDPVNLNVLRTIFAGEPYEVVTAISGPEALVLLDSDRWDLILSDVIMPGMSGLALTARIRERFSVAELPVLLLTARNRDADIEAGFASGANDYVTKPVNATELKVRVRALTHLKTTVNERLRMEAALLQAQVKPHFMINTFTALSALSRIDMDKMDHLVQELTHYYRLGIDFQNADEAVPLERELRLIRSYLFIQKERFADRLQVIWEVDDNLSLPIPPLTIQPLVENAITHGILKRSAGGEVRIRIADLGHAAEITVSDNGVGIEEAVVQQLLERQPDRRTGIGLLNTHRRLKQFGSKGLTIESRPGVGTSVSFAVAKPAPFKTP
ncbi:MAG: response regulator [Paenibacillaceae bacterium]|nr:response regulator [Paenibacillaceae bacterium]